ncbi:DUF6502 family protein [Aliiroseovarius sp.]|uniref:DUF6502 family protein n=1 Tax=Aliiroseovarius sp. TaxID=1872442 RepID=UPI003BACD777
MTRDGKDPFDSALAALLAPLARAMVAHGVTIGTGTEALKCALLQAVLDEEGEGISDSRASLQTGLHRKDVKRLRAEAPDEAPRRQANAAALVIGHWATDPAYQGTDGAPLDLPRKGNDGGDPGFDTLIRHARVDMAPGTVLTALIDQGVVEETPVGTLRLLTHAFLPKAGSAEQVAAYQATLSAHMQAATHNLLAGPDQARHFDRALRYSHLSAASVRELHTLAETRAQALLEELNTLAHALQTRDEEGEADPTGRFALGTYILPTPPEKDT